MTTDLDLDLNAELQQLMDDYTYRVNTVIEGNREDLAYRLSDEYEREAAQLVRIHQQRRRAPHPRP
jgi:hypothetical protein